jgi:hypothetical protein
VAGHRRGLRRLQVGTQQPRQLRRRSPAAVIELRADHHRVSALRVSDGGCGRVQQGGPGLRVDMGQGACRAQERLIVSWRQFRAPAVGPHARRDVSRCLLKGDWRLGTRDWRELPTGCSSTGPAQRRRVRQACLCTGPPAVRCSRGSCNGQAQARPAFGHWFRVGRITTMLPTFIRGGSARDGRRNGARPADREPLVKLWATPATALFASFPAAIGRFVLRSKLSARGCLRLIPPG